MSPVARFTRSMRWLCFVCSLLGCTDSSDARDAGGGPDARSPDAGAPAAAIDSGGRAEDGAADARVDAADGADPCAHVDCSEMADDCNAAACNPDTGECERTPRSDGTACGAGEESACTSPDSCLASVCERNHAPAGTSCGDPADGECDDPDTCDGEGVCQQNHEPSGVSCGDPADSECDDPDTCDGAGACAGNAEPSTTACGNPADGDCDPADSCDGAGACAANIAAAGAPCGDPADTDCRDPDTCDGAGVCLVHHADAGAPCGDQSVPCRLDDSCNASGTCVDAGVLAEGTLCGDGRNDECHNPDICDAAGNCQANDEAAGSRCRSCPAGVACECRGAVCVDGCAAFGTVEYGYRGCDDSAAVPPCADISSTGTALTLAPGAGAEVDIGFDFTLYGVTRRSLHVYEDGVLGFGDGALLPSAPECLAAGPLASTAGPAIVPFWTDFAPGGAVYYQTTGSSPGRTFSVQWTAEHAASGSGTPADIRVELAELGQGIRVCYVDTAFGSEADAGALAVAGITDAVGGAALAFSCNEPELPDGEVVDYYCTDGCPFTTTSDFDEWSDGDLLAALSPEWTGWNGDPATDSIVVDDVSHSPPNSLQIGANRDLVRPFDAGSSGVVEISAMSYVPGGMTGSLWFVVEDTYYPSGAQSWLSQITLDGTAGSVQDVGGTGVQSGGSAATVTLVRDAWVEVRIRIDLSARTYSSAYNGQALMTDRRWTLGASGSLHGAVDLFAGPDLSAPGYFDDVTIAKLPAPDCGNGIVEAGEQCDLGAALSDAAGSPCDTTCRYTSLIAWLDGADPNADGSAVQSGAAIAVWADKARASDAVQAEPAQRPTYVATGFGGGALSFDGVNDFLALPIDINRSALPSLTVITVIQNAPGHPTQRAGMWGNDSYNWGRFMASGGYYNVDGISIGNGVVTVAGLTAENVPLIVVATLVTGGPSTVHVNGRLAASFIESDSGPNAPTTSIGNIEGPELPPTGLQTFDGLIAEVMMFDRALGRAARNRIGTALAAKYGLVSYCGDGVTNTGEECDDGVNDGTACSANCTSVP